MKKLMDIFVQLDCTYSVTFINKTQFLGSLNN